MSMKRWRELQLPIGTLAGGQVFQPSDGSPPPDFECDSHRWRVLLILLVFIVSNALPAFGSPVHARQADQQATADGEVEKTEAGQINKIPQVSGSRLLAPSSFGFSIPAANVEPTDWLTVETVDNHDKKVIALIHCKVGKNYVVLLPNGRLVDRMADQVARSEKKFVAASQKEIAADVLENELSRFSKMKFERSKHFVFLHNTTPAFKNATLGILESMYNGVKAHAKNMGIETHDPQVPLVVIMFRTQAEYQLYREMSRGEAAFYDMVSNQVVLCQESPWAIERPDLARAQLLSTIAHEGAHQILHNIGVQQRLSMWPMWLSEGLAEFFAPTSLGKRNRWKGAGQVNDFRMFELESFLQTRYLEGLDGRTISEAVTAARLNSTGYAKAWSLVHYLAKKKRKELYALVSQMSQLPPMRGMVDRPGKPVLANMEHFQAFFGEDNKQTEADLIEYLGELDYLSPVFGYYHFVGLAQVPTENGSKKFACFFHTPDKVEEWKSVLESQLTEDQKQNTQWEVQKARDRGAANNLIRRFLR